MKRRGSGIRFVAAGAKPCGLGARDTLRLEMCYPLNGSDLSGSHTPLEAGLGAFVDFEKEHFTGRDALLRAKGERHRQKARRDPRSRKVASDSSALRDPGERRKSWQRPPAGRFRRPWLRDRSWLSCRSHLPRSGRIWKLRFGADAIEPVSSRSHFTSQRHECSRRFEVCRNARMDSR